jgi:hypothetical protein
MACVILGASWLALGCGGYEPEPAVPQPDPYSFAPPPVTAEELALRRQRAEEEAQGAAHYAETQGAQPNVAAIPQTENRDVVIGAENEDYVETDPSALTEFRPALEGHGTWVDDPTYGTVWVPASSEVGTDFQPYVSAGHWTYSDTTDYVWVSDYSWGWAPFHYGRWVYVAGPGWAWIPGRRYAGAWVTWRTGPVGFGYVGWAPMGPSWYWYGGSPYAWSYGWYRPYDYYVYCPHRSFYGPGMGGAVVRGPAAREFYGRTADYVPASPGVAGHTIASPSVGGSVGSGRVVASPSVGGKAALASRGPRPDEMGIGKDMVVAPPSNHVGLNHAQALSVPHPTTGTTGMAPASVAMHGMSTSAGAGRGPATASFVPSSANIPASSPTNAVARAPSYVSPASAAHASVASNSGFSSSSASRVSNVNVNANANASASSPSYVGHTAAPSSFAQSMRSGSSPAFHSSASTSGVRSYSAAAPAFRPSSGLGAARPVQAPSFHASSAGAIHAAVPHASAPVLRSSSGGGRRR